MNISSYAYWPSVLEKCLFRSSADIYKDITLDLFISSFCILLIERFIEPSHNMVCFLLTALDMEMSVIRTFWWVKYYRESQYPLVPSASFANYLCEIEKFFAYMDLSFLCSKMGDDTWNILYFSSFFIPWMYLCWENSLFICWHNDNIQFMPV